MQKTDIHLFILLIGMAGMLSCQKSEPVADAYGHFEAEELYLSSSLSGQLSSLRVSEGQWVKSGDTLGIVDHKSLQVQLSSFDARRSAIRARIRSLRAQRATAESEMQTLSRDVDRMSTLSDKGAATLRQAENLMGQLQTAHFRLKSFDPQIEAVERELDLVGYEEDMVRESISGAFILAPEDGFILQKYASRGEMVTPARPVLKMANTRQMTLKAYVDGSQLAGLTIGGPVTIKTDGQDGEILELDGVVSWVSEQAEFTPKIIQTRKERIDLVYAVKVQVSNPGYLKMGMPGELWISRQESR